MGMNEGVGAASDINVLDDVQPEAVPAASLQAIVAMGKRMAAMDESIKTLEQAVKDAKAERFKLATVELPGMMTSMNVHDVTMMDGRALQLKDVVTASIPSKTSIESAKDEERETLLERRAQAFAWLRDNNSSDLIKEEVSITFDRGKPIDGLLRMLARWKGISVTHEESVHAQTLNSFCKEQLSEGTNLPFDLFSVYTGQIVKIVSPKKPKVTKEKVSTTA